MLIVDDAEIVNVRRHEAQGKRAAGWGLFVKQGPQASPIWLDLHEHLVPAGTGPSIGQRLTASVAIRRYTKRERTESGKPIWDSSIEVTEFGRLSEGSK